MGTGVKFRISLAVMHVSLPKPMGSLLSSRVIEYGGVKTILEYRAVGQTIRLFPVDQVPDYVSQVDPLYFEEWVRLGKGIGQLIARYRRALVKMGLRIDGDFDGVVKAIADRWINAYGSLTPVLLDDAVTDVYVDEGGVRVSHRDYGLCPVALSDIEVIRPLRLIPLKVARGRIRVEDYVNTMVLRVAKRTRTPVTAYMPLISATDPEFKARFTVSTAPVSRPMVHVRLLPSKPWTLPALVKLGMLTVNQAALLWRLAEDKVPILIIGPMGSGKTSLANAIAMMLKPNALKVIIMDVDEMNLPGHLAVKLLERRSFGLGVRSITKDELIAHALRMGADYVIVNEVRETSEVKAWLNAVTTGHGGVTTFHADDYGQLAKRLSLMVPGSEGVLREMAIVVVGSEHVPVDVGGVRVVRRLRYVRDIVVPGSVDESTIGLKDDLRIRGSVITQLTDAPVEQLLATLSKLYSHWA